jgi:hypothetical protein
MQTKIELNEKQLVAWNYLNDKSTEIILYGGQSNSGKSWLGGVWLLLSALQYPGSRWGMCRKNLNDLKKTTLKTFLEVCKRYGIEKDKDFNINYQSNTINFKNGSEIYLINLDWRPSDPEAHFLGGYEMSGALIDELPQITQEYFLILYSRIRYKLDDFNISKKILTTCNPSNCWVKSYFYDRYIKGTLPEEIQFISTVGGYNPFRGKDYEKKLSMLSEQQLKRLEYGDWEYANSPDQLFNSEKLDEIMSPIQWGDDQYYITIDVARLGEDSTVIVLWKGMSVVKIVQLKQVVTTETVRVVREMAQEFKVTNNRIIADSDGVGGGVVDQLRCKGFVNNSKPFKGEKYDMLKSQCYFKLSKEKWSILDSVKPEYREQIKKELSSIRDASDDFKYKINSKDEQKKLLGGSSPDFSDALMMRSYFNFSGGGVKLDFL